MFSSLDIHFARFMAELNGTDAPELFLAAALVSHYRGMGHVCLDLSSVAGRPLPTEDDVKEPVVCPELAVWRNRLETSPVVGRPGEYKPLILDDRSRLYLYRYFEYQEKLAGLILERACDGGHEIDVPLLREGLGRLFPGDGTEDINWQKIAAVVALCKRFCVVTGGPGTGKTTTVAKIIALMLEQAGKRRVRIALAGPTGKAASRLKEAIKSAKEGLSCPDRIKEAIPSEASTIHRLLGSIHGSPYFRYNAQNVLPFDVVIVDEASMVDMALMSKLVQALSRDTRLILLGDKDQLASVEAGAVLGDICDSGAEHGLSGAFCSVLKGSCGHDIGPGSAKEVRGISDCIAGLQKSYRFLKESGIGEASRMVNTGDADACSGIFSGGRYNDIRWKSLPMKNLLPAAIREMVITGFGDYLKAKDPWEAFERFERFRILCALRKGPFGVTAINRLTEEILKKAGLIEHDKTWYPGRPVLISRNDYSLGLFNGDMGIVFEDRESNNEPRVFFPVADGTLRRLHPLRLPEHETVYAMTVHKSQGSEFDNVLFILPDNDYPVLTRELVYTGITRARKRVEIWGTSEVFSAAVSRRTERTSGLRDALWER
jgi:exodeoxyribonuclease V alpha subunit